MSEPMELTVNDEPAIIVTTGRGEAFIFADGGPVPEVTGLGAAVLVTRLRWWADHLEMRANLPLAVYQARESDRDE